MASPRAQVAAVVLVVVAVGLTFPAYVLGSVAAALALGVLKSMAAVGPGHSMSHFALFARGRWNTLVFRVGSPFLVSNPAIWSKSHIQSHHVFTLTAGDLQDNYPLKRVQPALRHRSWHRAQHVYAWVVYMFGLPLWALQDFARSVGSLFTGLHATARFTLAQRLENCAVIGVNLVFSVALPFFFLPFGRALLVCLLVNVPSSLLLVLQIAVNHEVPETQGNVVAGAPIDWGTHQVLTSHNYAVASPAVLHFSGGLNMQIEHHLFPSVHYSHYPALSRLVREACAEFGLPYHASRTVWEAVAKHYRVLRLHSVP
jgi:linoleoyl-CoA desaturase